MKDPILMGVAHQVTQSGVPIRVMNPECDVEFGRSVIPFLSGDSIVLIEGSRWQLTRPGHNLYDERLYKVSDSLVMSGIRPALRSIDGRANSVDAYAKVNKHLLLLIEFGSNEAYVQHHQYPSTFEELMKMLRGNEIKIDILKRPPAKVRRAAAKTLKQHKQFDEDHVSEIRLLQEKFDQVVLVAGLAHVMSISLKTGWQLITPPKRMFERSMRNTYLGYVNAHILPGLILSKKN